MNPLGLPILTSGTIRDYAPSGHGGGWGAPHSGPFNIAPQGAGPQCKEFTVPAGEGIRLAFAVADRNQRADSFSNVASRNNTTQEKIVAYITSDFEGQHIVTRPRIGTDPHDENNAPVPAKFDGRATGTDQPFGQYCSANSPLQQNGMTFKLPNGTYYLWLKAEDNSAFKIALLHQESNKI